ncbi:MAG: aminotransferase class I/II-fold pyridoxal phosphate-dependent enzyme [Clostridium sp.]|nr:aminotransferase class I/II-fold pyridoxal phosphate-dependent enzyme [Clostridium sp.]
MRQQHGGDIYGEKKIRLDFSVNTNPLGMPETVRQAVADSFGAWERYPDPCGRRLRSAAVSFYKKEGISLSSSSFLFGNGASDLLYSLVFALRPGRALLAAPSFSEYEKALAAVGTEIRYISLHSETGFSLEAEEDALFTALEGAETPDLVILTNPNNPNGGEASRECLMKVAERCRVIGSLLLVDECFGWFLEDWKRASMLPLLSEEPERFSHVVVLNAFTKIFSMAGLRLGFFVTADPSLLRRLESVRQPWSVSAPAEAAGLAAFCEKNFIEQSVIYVKKEREALEAGLRSLSFTVYPSKANYLLFRKRAEDSVDYAAACLAEGILIRRCDSFPGLDDSYYRVAVRRREENEILLACLKAAGERTEGSAWQKQL